jgi:hypothetical protein
MFAICFARHNRRKKTQYTNQASVPTMSTIHPRPQTFASQRKSCIKLRAASYELRAISYYAPKCSLITAAIPVASAFIFSSVSASTITRASASVPE